MKEAPTSTCALRRRRRLRMYDETRDRKQHAHRSTDLSHADHLGSKRLITDESGTNVSEYEYDPYGQRTAASEGIEQPYAFTGWEFDGESGLYYYSAGYYDARQGRFLSEDPIGFNGGDANLYRYVVNDPIRWFDPTGLRLTGLEFDNSIGLLQRIPGVCDFRPVSCRKLRNRRQFPSIELLQ